MLEIKPKHRIHLPHLPSRSAPLAFAPVLDDGDELTQAIVDAPQERDDAWELTERPDVEELTKFWSEVEADVAQDPEWFTFSDDR